MRASTSFNISESVKNRSGHAIAISISNRPLHGVQMKPPQKRSGHGSTQAPRPANLAEMTQRPSNFRKYRDCKMYPMKTGAKGSVFMRDAICQRRTFEDGKQWENTRHEAAFPTYSQGLAHFIQLFPNLSCAVPRGFPRFPIAQEACR